MNIKEQLQILMQNTDYGDATLKSNMQKELEKKLLEKRPLNIYCGYDPTAVDLTLGHIITMRKLRDFQQLGHNVTFLIGGFTGLIGDPSDKDKKRPMLTKEQLENNAKEYTRQAYKILDPSLTTIRSNDEWLEKISSKEFIQLCSHFTVAQFLERDNFSKRWNANDPIYLSEFLYALMQGYDAVQLKADVQIGGSDQLFNLMAGRILQREFNQSPQVIITLPILVGTDGKLRMSKSTGNFIGLDEEPNEMFGKIMSIPDSAVKSYFNLLTNISDDELDSLFKMVNNSEMQKIDIKKKLAEYVITEIFSMIEAHQAKEYFENTFQKRNTPSEMVEYSINDNKPEDMKLSKILHMAELPNGEKFAKSLSEVRRLIDQNAISINGNKISEDTLLNSGDEVRVGRFKFLRIVD
ncbi:MAG: tyrosine--tRNA ligase [Dehalococcoidia bacterium]|nr:tyrosine--tRNA ligase [Dehalococcoidia bacterium]